MALCVRDPDIAMHKVLMEYLVTEEDGANDSESADDGSMEDANDSDILVEDDDYAATDSTEEDDKGEDDESDGSVFCSDEDNGSGTGKYAAEAFESATFVNRVRGK